MTSCRSCGQKIGRSAQRCPKCGARQIHHVQRKWSVWAAVAVVGAVLLIGIIAAIVIPSQERQRHLLAAAAASEAAKNQALLDMGTLKLWVPAGVVGDDYWVYLNGHIVSAPPHGTRKQSDYFLSHVERGLGDDNKEGWNLETYDLGESLYIRDGAFLMSDSLRRYIDRNFNPSSGDAKHLFYPVDLHLRAGKYIVEVLYLSKSSSGWAGFKVGDSFPFAISPKYIASVKKDGMAHLRIGVPNDWNDYPGTRAKTQACNIFNGRPNMDQIIHGIQSYMADPVVQALRTLDVSILSQPKGIVVLGLPPAYGGAREFEVSQITYIANAILYNYEVGYPEHEDIVKCRHDYPGLSQTYDELDMMVSDLESQLQLVHTLAGK